MNHAPVHHAPDTASAVGLRPRTVQNAPNTAFSRCYKEPMKHATVYHAPKPLSAAVGKRQ